jgi:hypothetical protein
MRAITKKRVLEICKNCHKKSWYISSHSLCPDCAQEKVLLARQQMKCKQGEIYEKWKANIIKGLSKLT